jgi:hypothetical protein
VDKELVAYVIHLVLRQIKLNQEKRRMLMQMNGFQLKLLKKSKKFNKDANQK